jgi:hypothetical protein
VRSAAPLIRAWERFWFADVPSEAFALVRVAVGAAGLVNLIGSTPIEMFWLPDGVAPLPGGGVGLRTFVLESGLGAVAGWAFFLTLFASFICMTVGLFTGFAVTVCFVGTILQGRWNPLPLTSGHGVLLAALFCLLWTDCGASLSMDARRRRSLLDAEERPLTSPAASDMRSHQPIWPLRLIRIQVALIYFTSGVFKLLGPAWRDGSAVHYATGQNVYGRIFHVYAFPAGFDWLLTALTYATVLWELSFPFLLLNRTTRKFALWSGLAMHLGIWSMMEVGPFTWMMLAAYTAFLDPDWAVRMLAVRKTGNPSPEADPVASMTAAGPTST